jgi:hypothetical protein
MRNEELFVEIAKKKVIINQLQNEVNISEKEIKTTFYSDVYEFFISKGYEFEEKVKNDYSGFHRFKEPRQKDEKSTFNSSGKPRYKIGKTGLIVRFEWHLEKNSNWTSVYWYPEKQTLEEFYNKRLKKTLVLPIKIERKNKLDNIKKNNS